MPADCFTIAAFIEQEATGLTPEGQGSRAILAGCSRRERRLAINPSGGLKCEVHPIGATGVAIHARTAVQCAGEAGATRLHRAE